MMLFPINETIFKHVVESRAKIIQLRMIFELGMYFPQQ
jgi:hypothetical protein